MRVRRILAIVALCLLLVLPVSAHGPQIRSASHRNRLGGLPTVAYDSNAVTFTAGMAKRSGPGPFAAAAIVQGKWDGTGTGDEVTFSRSGQIVGVFYDNFDFAQGTIVFWVTPEWDGNDGVARQLLRFGERVFLSTQTNLLRMDAQDVVLATQRATIDISAWTAGTTYLVVGRWDMTNTLDGTNFAAISVDDVGAFGGTTAAGPPGGTGSAMNVGSDASGQNLADAIIEGLHIYRRVLFDGAYGTDVGNGDELAAIYAAGAGADPTLTTGSWDVVFALPTDSSTGALTSGTGEAWSHPHSSCVMGDCWGETDYQSSAWSTVGTPTSITNTAAISTAQQLFGAGGYGWTADASGEGITQTVTGLVTDTNYVVRVLAHSDVTITTRVWDVTNEADIVADFIVAPTTYVTTPAVSLFTFELPTIARNGADADSTAFSVAVLALGAGDVFVHQAEVQAQLIDNPSLETGSGDPWIPDGWTNIGLDAGDSEAEAATVHSGAVAMQWNVGAGSSEGLYDNVTTGVGVFYSMGGWHYGNGAAFLNLASFSMERGLLQHSTTDWQRPFAAAAAWNPLFGVWRALSTNMRPLIQGTSAQVYLDDLYLLELDTVTLTVTPASEPNSAESGGLRGDGADVKAQPILGMIDADAFSFTRTWRPRHAAANLVAFGAADAYYIHAWGDASNYVSVYGSATNQLTLAFNDGDGEQSATWDATGLIDADGSYLMEARSDGNTTELVIDGTVRAEITDNVDFATLPTIVYWDNQQDGTSQGDGVSSEP